MSNDTKNNFQTARDLSVTSLRGVGESRAKTLEKLGINSLLDLLRHFPRDWQDRHAANQFPDPDKPALRVFFGKVVHARSLSAGMRLSLFKAEIATAAGTVFAVWFRRKNPRFDAMESLKKEISLGANIWIIGRAETSISGKCEVRVEEYYLQGQSAYLHVDRLTPIYPLTEGLTQKFFREIEWQALSGSAKDVPEFIPHSITVKRQLLVPEQAVKGIHFPQSRLELEEARRRFVYEELFFLSLAWQIKRRQTREANKNFNYQIKRSLLTPFKNKLGFEFTAAQKRAINEIFSDMQESFPMSRLLQGDVGSGKTAVAISAILLTVENGAQAALMVPSEILAEQHYATLSRALQGLPVKIEILTSRLKSRERKEALRKIKEGEVDIVVGTHALIEEDVVFKNLRLAVVDEQHRFGVRQRATLKRKGQLSDLLVMTATPIPRTLALALYGDLDVSTLDQMPPGRVPPRTFFSSEAKALEAVRREIQKGRQAYIVYPVIEESAKQDLLSAKAEFKRLSEGVFSGISCGLIHGALKSADKIEVMEDFNSGKVKILIATQVIEIGIDVPNASIMVIQNAERFGLASLHQLRGRIGRGSGDSECHLVGNPQTPESKRRIEVLLESHDGFRLSEEDMALRGSGEIIGTLQHGDFGFHLADLSKDEEILKEAREDAEQILSQYPNLNLPEHESLRMRLRDLYQEHWSFIDLA